MAENEFKDTREPDQDENSQRKRDIESERLEIERARLELERSRQRSTLPQMALQIGLPLLATVIALAFSAYSDRQRRLLDHQNATLEYNKAVSSYNDGRLELFRRRADRATNDDQIKSIYAEVFPRDSVTLRHEQQDVMGK